MYQIAICDDEQAVCEMVSGVIGEWNKDIQISCFGSGEELLAAYDSFDVIFLDIDMKGMDGIETGRRPGSSISHHIVIMWRELLRFMHSSIC